MPKVMLIEDDATMLSLLCTLLEIEGFQVAQAKGDMTLNDILNAIRQEMPAVILLDVHLNQLNGFDLLNRVRQDDELKDLKILMSSGMEVGIQCRQQGADGFILKPYMPDELVNKIHQMILESN